MFNRFYSNVCADMIVPAGTAVNAAVVSHRQYQGGGNQWLSSRRGASRSCRFLANLKTQENFMRIPFLQVKN